MNSTSPIPPHSDDARSARTGSRTSHPVHVSAGAPPPSLAVGDIYYVLFRHKWRILFCGLAGLISAVVVYIGNPPPYRSESKLFIRYVFVDGGTTAARGQESQVKTPDQRGETIMDSESEILTSLDLARQVAQIVGPEKILAKMGGGNDLALAASVVNQGLVVDIPQRSSVIHVTFYHPDARVVQPVLGEVINQYYKMHLSIHQAKGIVGDFLMQETDQLKAKLADTTEELRRATAKAGVSSFDDARKNYASELARLRTEIYSAQAELAERKSIYDEFAKRVASGSITPTGEIPIPAEKVNKFRSINTQLDLLRKREQDLLSEFTPESPRVANMHALVTETELSRQKLVAEYPRLEESGPVAASAAIPFDPSALAAQIVATQSKIAELSRQFEQMKAEAAKVEEMAGSVEDLRRRKDLEEANYRYYAASLEQSRINEALGAGKVSNITEIQRPSPPIIDKKKSFKLIGAILVGGLAAGIGWSFFIELYLDRSVRRPIDVERMFGLPLFLSVPALDRRERKRLTAAREMQALPAGESDLSPSTGQLVVSGKNGIIPDSSLLYSFHETLRDRLIGYFESRGLTHKPKLVAVTGLGRGSGVTTTAAGLATSLSQTGEGNVLLVDMTAGQGSAQHFYRGEKIVGLEEILALSDNGPRPRGTEGQVQDHLYVVGEEPGQDKLSRILPQRFTKLVPKLKASNFDYIIFDMPPVSQISITPRLAGFMDMVLLVIESEKTDREIVQRATALLAQSKAHVGAVLNKNRTYVPSALHQEYLGNG